MNVSLFLVQVFIVIAPAFVIYSQIPRVPALFGGMGIGIVLGVHSHLLPYWSIVLAILIIVYLMFSETQTVQEAI